MKISYLAAVAAAAFVSTSASAADVFNTSLQNINGPFGTSTAQTTTDANGTRTEVTGPGPNAGANRANGTPVLNSWFQTAIGAGSTVGITTDFARNGNGSAYFAQTQSDTGKGDLQYYFGSSATGSVTPFALSGLTSFSYDYYRVGTSTNDPIQTPVLRLDVLKDGVFAGSLVYEPYYTTNSAAPVDTWTTGSGTLTAGNWWSNNTLLGANPQGVFQTLQAWIDANNDGTLTVYGVNVGFGSGWQNVFTGAVDNVSVQFGNAGGVNSNFEVAVDSAVPEPATWALMMLGFGAIGYTLRRRRATVAFA